MVEGQLPDADRETLTNQLVEGLQRGSFEIVTVKAQAGENVLVARAGGQTTYRADELEPYDPDFCPLP